MVAWKVVWKVAWRVEQMVEAKETQLVDMRAASMAALKAYI